MGFSFLNLWQTALPRWIQCRALRLRLSASYEIGWRSQKCQKESGAEPRAAKKAAAETALAMKEAVSGQFDRARFAKNSAGAYAQPSGLKLFFVFLIHAVVAVILLRIVFTATNGMEERSGRIFKCSSPMPWDRPRGGWAGRRKAAVTT